MVHGLWFMVNGKNRSKCEFRNEERRAFKARTLRLR
jgi:hypothetical protein